MRVQPANLIRGVVRLLALVLTGITVGGLIGQVARDRWWLLAALYHLPIIPIGLGAVLLDLILGGRTVRRPRFGVTVLGLAGLFVSAGFMTGHAEPAIVPAGAPEARVVQWNVQWGGGRGRTDATWRAIVDDALARGPDIVVLSEAPDPAQFQPFARLAGGGWREVSLANAAGETYWYRMTIASRWPIDAGGRHAVRNGAALSARVRAPWGSLRVLAVDGMSDPKQSRGPFLEDVAALCEAARRAGDPFDVVAGDFNTTARSVHFDPLRRENYAPASDLRFTFRATYPAWCPLYDVDHVWLAPGVVPRSCALFSNSHTDHLGLEVTLCALVKGR
jgi:endonuclease/exonuclease/phosphatase family metal-dependent hydrolase